MELKKLQTPLYEEFFNSLNTPPAFGESKCDETAPSYLRLPPKSRSPSRAAAGTSTPATDGVGSGSPGSNKSRRISNVGNASNQSSPDVGLPQSSDLKGLVNGGLQDSSSPRLVSLESILSSNKFIYIHIFVSYSAIVLNSLTFCRYVSFFERQKKWKEELDQELKTKRGRFSFPSFTRAVLSFLLWILSLFFLANTCAVQFMFHQIYLV